MAARLARFIPALTAFVLASLFLFFPPFLAMPHGTQQANAAPVLQEPPSPTPFPTPTPEPEVAVDLLAEEPQVEAGELVTYTVVITNTTDNAVNDLVLTGTLPPSVTFVSDPQSVIQYDPVQGALLWNAGTIPADTILTATYQVQVDPAAPDTLALTELSAEGANLTETLNAWDVGVVGEAPPDEMWVTPEGGSLKGASLPISVVVPEEALSEPLYFQISAASPLTQPAYLWSTFHLTATTKNETVVTTFPTSITIAVDLSDYITAALEISGTPSLYWLNESTQAWELVPGNMDWGAWLLTAPVDHFSTFGFGASSVGSYGIQHLPTVHGYAPDEFSGNSTYAYPIELPPGPAGFGMPLGLSYSSEGANALFAGKLQGATARNLFQRQAGIVGWGWQLTGLGSITRDMAESELESDRFFLSFGGGSYELIPAASPPPGSVRVWYTSPQSFLRVESHQASGSGSYNELTTLWHVWAPDGTHYVFGSASWGNEAVAYFADPADCTRNRFREAYLSAVIDPNGNRIDIGYGREMRTAGCQYVSATRPLSLTYKPVGQSQATVKVDFSYNTRTDTGIEGTPNTQQLVTGYRLETILVSVRSATGSGYDPAHSYQLVHSYDNWANHSDRGILLLTSITRRGYSGGALPSHTFTYEHEPGSPDSPNFNVLKTTNNSQGGVVTYTYAHHDDILIRGCGASQNAGLGGSSFYTQRFRVAEVAVNDGFGDSVYHYYNVLPPNITDTNTVAFAHGKFDTLNCRVDFEFGGFKYSRHEIWTDGTRIQSTVTDFHQGDGGNNLLMQKGRAWRVRTFKPEDENDLDANRLQQQITHWGEVTPTQATRNQHWVYKKAEETYLYGSANMSTRTEYEYDVLLDGGWAYGNLRRVREYVNGNQTPLRSQMITYTLPAVTVNGATVTRYMVDRISDTRSFAGAPGGTCLSRTQYAYDGNAYNGTIGNGGAAHGRRTRERTYMADCVNASVTTTLETLYAYDVYGNLTTTTDPKGRVTTTYYDTSGWRALFALPVRVVAPPIGSTQFESRYLWNLRIGQVERVTDTNGVVTRYIYDEFARISETMTLAPVNSQTKYVYTPYGGSNAPARISVKTLLKSSPDLWQMQHTYYDGLGRAIQNRVSYSTSHDSVTRATYHPLGGVRYAYSAITSPASTTYLQPGAWNGAPYTRTDYDALGRPILARATDNTITSIAYDVVAVGGRPLLRQESTDPLNHRQRQYTDVLGQLVRVEEITGTNTVYATTLYTYTVTGLLDTVRDNAGNTTDMNYDFLGRKIRMDDPDMGIWQYAYDKAGNLTAQYDARGNGVCFLYDTHNRMTGKRVYMQTTFAHVTGCANTQVSNYAVYTYDNGIKGPRTGMTDTTGYASWTYDAAGRLLREDKTIKHNGIEHDFALAYSYDQAGRMSSLTYMPGMAGAETVNYTYDAGYPGRLNQMASSSPYQPYLSNTSYNQFGQLTGFTFGTSNALTQEYIYHPLAGTTPGESQGRLAQVNTGAGGNLWQQQYRYDVAGNVEQVNSYRNLQEWQERHFRYDPLDRLTLAWTTGSPNGAYNESYTYDKIGNMTARSGVNYSYDPLRPHGVTGLSNGKSYQYDAAGNQTHRRYVGGGGTPYTDTLHYDGENRLTQINFGDTFAPPASYAYDGDGNRVRATIDGLTTLYPNAFIEYRVNSNILTKYYHADGQRIAMREGSTLYYFVSDHLGSTALTLNQNGTLYSETRYKPFGETAWSSAPAAPTRRRYTGQLQDFDLPAMQLYFYNARYYDPALARFTQADTLVPQPGNPQSFNRYSYVLNNPLKYTDPTGHCGAEFNSSSGYSREEAKTLYQSCVDLREQIAALYGISITGQWLLTEMQVLEFSMQGMADFLGGADILATVFSEAAKKHGNTQFVIKRERTNTTARYRDRNSEIIIGNTPFATDNVSPYRYIRPSSIPLLSIWENSAAQLILHEVGHVILDVNPRYINEYRRLRSWTQQGPQDGLGVLAPSAPLANGQRGNDTIDHDIVNSMSFFILGALPPSTPYQVQRDYVMKMQAALTAYYNR